MIFAQNQFGFFRKTNVFDLNDVFFVFFESQVEFCLFVLGSVNETNLT